MIQTSKVLHAPLHSLWALCLVLGAWAWALLAAYERLIGSLAGATAGIFEGLARAVLQTPLLLNGGGGDAPSRPPAGLANKAPAAQLPSPDPIPVIACVPDVPLEPLPEEQLSSLSAIPAMPPPKLATTPAPHTHKPAAVAGPPTPTRPAPVSVEALSARHEHVTAAPGSATVEATEGEKKKKRHRSGPLRKAVKGVKNALRL